MTKKVLKFYTETENIYTQLINNSVIQLGDNIFIELKKYKDKTKSIFLGNTYIKCNVINSKQLDNEKFLVDTLVCMTIFINNNIILASGVCNSYMTLSEGKIINIEHNNSSFSIIGGTGHFEGCYGNYKIDKDNVELTIYKKNKNSTLLIIIIILLLLIICKLYTS